MITSVCGVSRSGCVYFGEAIAAAGVRPVTSTDSPAAANSSTAVVEDVSRNRTLVPTTSAPNACSAVRDSVTPGD